MSARIFTAVLCVAVLVSTPGCMHVKASVKGASHSVPACTLVVQARSHGEAAGDVDVSTGTLKALSKEGRDWSTRFQLDPVQTTGIDLLRKVDEDPSERGGYSIDVRVGEFEGGAGRYAIDLRDPDAPLTPYLVAVIHENGQPFSRRDLVVKLFREEKRGVIAEGKRIAKGTFLFRGGDLEGKTFWIGAMAGARKPVFAQVQSTCPCGDVAYLDLELIR